MAVGAALAALLESSVLPELGLAGVKPDLLFVLAVCAAVVLGVEDGLAWAFVGGLMLDLLLPSRAVGTTALVLLLLVAVAVLVGRKMGQRHVLLPALVFAGTWLYQFLLLVVVSSASGIAVAGTPPSTVFATAVSNALLAVPVSAAARWYVRRKVREAGSMMTR